MANQPVPPIKTLENNIPQQYETQTIIRQDNIVRCFAHGKRRSAKNLQLDTNGHWNCRPEFKCSDRPHRSGKLVLCSLHDKKRTMMHMMPDGDGNYKCRPGSECRGGEHKYNNNRHLQRNDPRWGWYPGMETIRRNKVRSVPKSDISFGSNTAIAIDFNFVYGMPPGVTDSNDDIETMPFPVAGTIFFWDAGSKLVLFQGRIAVPEGVSVIDDSLITERADLDPPWVGTSLDTIKTLLSIYGRAAWSSKDGTMMIGHSAKYYLQSLNVKWPSSLIFDISENYQSETPDCPIKLEDAYLETVRPVLPGDPMDPLVRCRLAVELYLFHKDLHQNNSFKIETEQDSAQGNPQNNSFKRRKTEQDYAQGHLPPPPPPPPPPPMNPLVRIKTEKE